MTLLSDRQRGLTRVVRAGDIELRVMERGTGMPVLMVHGFPLDHSMWDEQIAVFSERWRVIAPDLRGFGGSQVTPGTASIEQMADDLNALLDTLGVGEPVVFCGLSAGGYVALQFWRKYHARLRGLVLCDTRAAADTPEGVKSRMKMADHVLRAGTEYLADAMLPKLFAPETFQNRANAVNFERQKILDASPQGVVAALHGLAERPDATGYLPDIRLPTLVVVGEHDSITTVDEMRSVAEKIADAEFVVIPQAGHMTPLENPTLFNEVVGRFLEKVERRA